MNTRLPSYQEMQVLVAFLPRLYAEGFKPVIRWHGGDQGKDGLYRMPWPEYDPLVEEFYRQVASDGWLDYEYNLEEAASMLEDDDLIKTASLPQVKAMLTFCVRGERFSDGHWAEMIENGNIRKLLIRIDELSREVGRGQASR
jgi:hypothetical protein